MQSVIRAQIIKFFKFSFAFALIAWMISRGHLDVHDFDLLLNPYWALILFLVAGLNLVLTNWRWALLLAAKQFPSSFKVTFPLTLMGIFFNYAVPGAIGGDLVKVFYLVKDHPQRKMLSISTILLDRVIGLYAMTWLAMCSVLMDMSLIMSNPKLQALGLGIILALVLQTAILGVSFSSRLNKMFNFLYKVDAARKLYEVIHSYRAQKMVLVKTLAISFLSQAVSIFFLWLVGVALHETNIPVSTFLFAVPIGFMISALPISPAGIGIGQVAFLILFQLHSGQQTQLGQISISIFQLVLFVWGLFGAFFYVKGRKEMALETTAAG